MAIGHDKILVNASLRFRPLGRVLVSLNGRRSPLACGSPKRGYTGTNENGWMLASSAPSYTYSYRYLPWECAGGLPAAGCRRACHMPSCLAWPPFLPGNPRVPTQCLISDCSARCDARKQPDLCLLPIRLNTRAWSVMARRATNAIHHRMPSSLG